MITANQINQVFSCTTEPFEDRIEILYRELELAIKWQRPSILLAVYRSEYIHADAEAALKNRLFDLGQNVHHLQVKNEENADILLLLTEIADQDKTIFFVEGLRWGGGEDGFNAYRALNKRREFFIENAIRVVFWLTESEAIDLARYAPDYWAYRHRVIEFTESPKPEQISLRAFESAWQGIGEYTGTLEDIDAKISLRESMLADLPQGNESTAIRASLLFSLGILHWRKGDFETATKYLSTALEIAVKTEDKWFEAVCLNAMALVKTDLGRIDEAIEDYKRAINLAPDQVFPWNNLGNLYSKLDRNDEAVEAFQQAIEQNPDDAVSWNGLGTVYHKMGYADDAISAFEKAVELDADFAYPWVGLGNVYESAGRLGEAIAAYKKATQFSERILSPWINLGNIYENQKRDDEAIRAFQKAIDVDPKNAQAWNQLGNIYFNTAAYDEALKAYQMAIELDHGYGWPYSNLALLYANSGKFEEAIPLFQKSLEFFECNKDKAVTLNRMGDAYRKMNDYENAIVAYRRADQLDPKNAPPAGSDGEILLRTDSDEGSDALEDRIMDGGDGAQMQDDQPSLVATLANDIEVERPIDQNEDKDFANEISEADGEDTVETSPDTSLLSHEDEDLQARIYGQDRGKDILRRGCVTGKEFSCGLKKEVNEATPDHLSQEDVGVKGIKAAENALTGNVPISNERVESDRITSTNTGEEDHDDLEGASVVVANLEMKGEPQEASTQGGDVIEDDGTPNVAKPGATGIEPDTVPVKRAQGNNDDEPSAVDEAIATYLKVTEINPNNARAWDTLGNLYRISGFYSEAFAAFQKAISLEPEREVYYYHLGLVYAAQKRHDEAVDAFQKVLELNPDYHLAHCAIAGNYRKLGQENEAKEHINIALPKMGNEKEYNRACFEAICGNVDQAIELLTGALEKKQTPMDWVRRDPDLDFIRDDPRYRILVGA